MAKVRLLNDDELTESLKRKFQSAKVRVDRLKQELDICRSTYQCVSHYPAGALDAGQVTNAMFNIGDDATQELVLSGLDLAKAVLFLHSKLCISEPVVTATPLNQDTANKRAAESAQYYIPHFRKATGLQEILEVGPYLNTTVDGNGITFVGWNPDGGEYPVNQNLPDDPDELLMYLSQNDVEMEGDHEIRNVPVDNFFIDAAADTWENANHCFELREIPMEQAMFQFNSETQIEYLEAAKANALREVESTPEEEYHKKNTVKIYEYWERGRPWNGFIGLHVIFVDALEPKILVREPNKYRHRKLPYAMMTDVDIPGNPYGMSRIVYAYQVQKNIDMLVSMIMDNIHLHGSARFLYPEGSVDPQNLTNEAGLGIPYNGSTGGKPEWFRPANVTTDVWKGYEILRSYINNIYGMNEFSQGQIPRELSSYAVQLALEMDDKYRIRLFNKKKKFLRDIYLFGLENTKQFMDDSRKLMITGVEGRPDSVYFSASDLIGEYALDVDFGTYVPVDPAARKQQLLEFIKSGFYEKAGGNVRKLASLLIDGSMLDIKDDLDASSKRQQREIDRIIAGETVRVEAWDEHEQHIAEVENYARSETFELLPREIKEAIWSHAENHVDKLAEQLAKSQQGAPGAPGAPGGMGGQGMPPGGMDAPPAPPKPGAGPQNPMTQPSGPMI